MSQVADMVDHRIHVRRQSDRKSTRLNSSHGYTSYAVFCLKKKNTLTTPRRLPQNSRTSHTSINLTVRRALGVTPGPQLRPTSHWLTPPPTAYPTPIGHII